MSRARGPAVMKALHRQQEMAEPAIHQVTEWRASSFLARENEFGQQRQGLLEWDKWTQERSPSR